MVNFRVGDRVEVINASGSVLENGDIGVIAILEGTAAKVRVNEKPSWGNWVHVSNLKLVSADSQRIESLEKRVEELEKLAKYFEVHVEPSVERPKEEPRIPKGLMKKPNQLRAEIIEKAKGFSEIEQYRRKIDGKFVIKSTIDPFDWAVRKIQFVANDKKRTVVLLIFSESGKVIDRHIAKCNPSDVFNEHIGKAIALGRALGLDVSEFEWAVQPTEVVEGMKIQYPFEKTPVEVLKDGGYYIDADTQTFYSSAKNNEYITFINDTQAIYEEV